MSLSGLARVLVRAEDETGRRLRPVTDRLGVAIERMEPGMMLARRPVRPVIYAYYGMV